MGFVFSFKLRAVNNVAYVVTKFVVGLYVEILYESNFPSFLLDATNLNVIQKFDFDLVNEVALLIKKCNG